MKKLNQKEIDNLCKDYMENPRIKKQKLAKKYGVSIPAVYKHLQHNVEDYDKYPKWDHFDDKLEQIRIRKDDKDKLRAEAKKKGISFAGYIRSKLCENL